MVPKSILPQRLLLVRFPFHRGSRGRVVKAMDLKSIGVSPRRFESCRLRYFYSIFTSNHDEVKIMAFYACRRSHRLPKKHHSRHFKYNKSEYFPKPLVNRLYLVLRRVNRQNVELEIYARRSFQSQRFCVFCRKLHWEKISWLYYISNWFTVHLSFANLGLLLRVRYQEWPACESKLATFSFPSLFKPSTPSIAEIAQLGERQTEDLKVPGSNPESSL